MGWQDRPYSAPQRGGWGGGFDWRQLIFGSLYVGEYFGIAVRLHSSLLLLGAFNILFAGTRGGMGIKNAIVSTLLLFLIILLHEFGHCFAARRVGGDAREILLWPLGGLAFVTAPQRPMPSFVTSAGGPLVNVVICVLTGGALLAMSGGQFSLPLNPLIPFGGDYFFNDRSFQLIAESTFAYYLWWIYITSWTLLFFNLLPIFPLDGGQMFQAILWTRLGYYRSMNFACTTGMIGAVITGLVGIASGRFMLCFLAYAGFMYCRQMQMNLREYSDAAYEAASYSTPTYSTPRAKTPRPRRPTRPRDDKFTLRDLNPFERIARARRKKQFERLMRDD
jgi:Zn-dependent protease